jgi:mono/diheme cytochrome c family protein
MKFEKLVKPRKRASLCLAAALWASGTLLASSGVQAQNPERGRLLYENHCEQCHSEQIHGRSGRIVHTPEELRAVVRRWQSQQHLNWSDEDIEDVARYLGTMRYGFE